jgi:hypothetical protein
MLLDLSKFSVQIYERERERPEANGEVRGSNGTDQSTILKSLQKDPKRRE